MYTKQDLLDQLSNIGVDPNGTLKIHISYKAIGEVENRGDTVLDALMEYMKPGLLVLAAHTWANVKAANPVMDVQHTPTCVGVLTEMFRKRDGVVRSMHPTHSVAAVGNDAEKFVAGNEMANTPCGFHSPYYKLWERDAQILLIGVDFSRNTFIHGIEEWDKAAGTLKQESEDYYIMTPHGHKLYAPQFRHCAPHGSATFTKLEPYAFKEGILTFGKFGNATTRLVRAKALRALAAKFLQEDPWFLAGY